MRQWRLEENNELTDNYYQPHPIHCLNCKLRDIQFWVKISLMYSVVEPVNPFYRLQRSCGKVMFLHLSVILFTGGGCLPHPRVDTPLADTLPAQFMLGYTPPAQCMLGYTPPAQCMLGYTPPCPVHAGIWSTSGRYTSHWNAFFFKQTFRKDPPTHKKSNGKLLCIKDQSFHDGSIHG